MTKILLSGIGMAVILLALFLIFKKLKNIKKYNILIFLALTVFWCSLSLIRATRSPFYDIESKYQDYVWALVIAGYQFTQALVRIPIGLLSKKLKSRKIPIILVSSLVVILIAMVLGTNFSSWSIITAIILSGVFGATFGLQNQYWSENFNIRSIFISIGIVSILPSFGALFANFVISIGESYSFEITKWMLFAVIIILIITLYFYFLLPERKDTITLDNVSDSHTPIAKLKFKSIFILSLQVIFITYAFNVATSDVSFQDDISANNEISTIVLTMGSIFVAIFSAMFLFKVFNTRFLIYLSHIIIIISAILGTIFGALINHSVELRILYLSLVTIGFTIFQNILIGNALHFDHKNKMLVLGIWLTFRSAAVGFGKFSGELILKRVENSDVVLPILLIIFSIISIIYFIFITTNNKNKLTLLFNIVDKYEHKDFKFNKRKILHK